MTPTINCFFDPDEIAHLDQAPTERIEHLARGYLTRTGNAADSVCFGKLLLHMKHRRLEGPLKDREKKLYDWLAAQCAAAGVRKYRKTQLSEYLRIGKLDPREVLGRPLCLYSMYAVAGGPTGTSEQERQIRLLLLKQAEITPEENIHLIASAAEHSLWLLSQDLPLDKVLDECKRVARGELVLPGKGKKKPPSPDMQARTKAQDLLKALQKIKQGWDGQGPAPLSDKTMLVLEAAQGLAAHLAGPEFGPANFDEKKNNINTIADAPPNPGTPPPPAARAGATAAPDPDPRKYPREAGTGGPLADPPADSLEDEDQDDGELVDPDYYVAIARAVMAALPPPEQEELGRLLADIVRGAKVEQFTGRVRGLWERCGLEAAGVDRDHFDFFIDQMCGADWTLRGQHALAFLEAGQPPDWAWQVHLLGERALPPELREQVLDICERVPPVQVELEGPEAAATRRARITIALLQRIMPDIPEAAYAVQRILQQEATECFLATCEVAGPPLLDSPPHLGGLLLL